MSVEQDPIRYLGALIVLLLVALLLGVRLVYLYLADPQRFPISTVKIASLEQQARFKDIEPILEKYWNHSFFSFPASQLQEELAHLNWVKRAEVNRVWPDVLKINLFEKIAVAYWNDVLITEDGDIFAKEKSDMVSNLPHLWGPENKQQEVLQIYQKMSNILSVHNLFVASLVWRESRSVDLELTNGIHIRLGKENLEARITRFCKAYPAVFAGKTEQLATVDLRYPQGMAVEWKN